MKSYMLSTLARRFATSDLDTFKQAHPHEWLVWEPGAWRPAQHTTILVATPPPQPTGGEVLALALEPAEGKTGVTFGRGEECDLTLNDGTLSTVHLLFMRAPDRTWTVRDAKSKNGSHLGPTPLTPGVPFALTNGQQLFAAQVALTFYTAAGMLHRLRTS